MHSFISYNTPFTRRMRFTTKPPVTVYRQRAIQSFRGVILKQQSWQSSRSSTCGPPLRHLFYRNSIRVLCIPHIGTKRKPLTKAESRKLFQVVLSFFFCCHVLRLPDIHPHVDKFVAYNGMVLGYTENLFITCTLIIKHLISYRDHL